MRIVIDRDVDAKGNVMAEHVVHTNVAAWNKVTGPGTGNVPIDLIQFLKQLHAGTIPIAGTGWEEITNHPLYPGLRKLDAFLGEIVRLNDAPARSILGV